MYPKHRVLYFVRNTKWCFMTHLAIRGTSWLWLTEKTVSVIDSMVGHCDVCCLSGDEVSISVSKAGLPVWLE